MVTLPRSEEATQRILAALAPRHPGPDNQPRLAVVRRVGSWVTAASSWTARAHFSLRPTAALRPVVTPFEQF